jgi:hypothetical protein
LSRQAQHNQFELCRSASVEKQIRSASGPQEMAVFREIHRRVIPEV